MKNPCEPFREEMAAFVSNGAGLSAQTAAHLEACAACRKSMEEFEALAALQMNLAFNLVEPKRYLTRTRLERALVADGQNRRQFQFRWRPVLAGAVTMAFLIAGVVFHRMGREESDASPKPEYAHHERIAHEDPFEPTMLALRYEVAAGREQMLAGNGGGAMRSYRVRDVESESEN